MTHQHGQQKLSKVHMDIVTLSNLEKDALKSTQSCLSILYTKCKYVLYIQCILEYKRLNSTY